MKQQTIPKLELQMAISSVRVRQLITQDHDVQIQAKTHWTDFMTVLEWLPSAHKKEQAFEASPFPKLLDQFTVDEWKHACGKNNKPQ